MFFSISRRPLLAAIALLRFSTNRDWTNLLSGSNDISSYHPDAIVEDCSGCQNYPRVVPFHLNNEQPSSTVTTTVTRTILSKATNSPTTENQTNFTLKFTDTCRVFGAVSWIEHFWTFLAVLPFLTFLPNYMKRRRQKKLQAQQETLIADLSETNERLEEFRLADQRIVDELTISEVECHHVISTISERMERLQQEVLHEKEKVAMFVKQHLELSDARQEIAMALERLQVENRDLRVQMHEQSACYRRVCADLPAMLLPPTMIASSSFSESVTSNSTAIEDGNA